MKRMKIMKLILPALLLMLAPGKLLAYTDVQIVKFDGNTYKVVSATGYTLSFLGCDDSKKGVLDIPQTVNDGHDVTFTVTEVGGGRFLLQM